jgi:hypothetical protein
LFRLLNVDALEPSPEVKMETSNTSAPSSKQNEGGGKKKKGKKDKQQKKLEKKEKKKAKKQKTKEELLKELDPNSEEYMMLKMGFPVGFDSTKGKQVEGADVSYARIRTARQYRQYMNRRGGFNKLLDPEHSGKKLKKPKK